MDETGTFPSAGSSRFRFNGFASSASQHEKCVHPEVKRFLAGKGELCNWVYQRFSQRPNEGTGKARTGTVRLILSIMYSCQTGRRS